MPYFDIADQVGVIDGRAVDGHFVGPGGQQPSGVFDRCDAAADRERDVDVRGDARHQFGKSPAPFHRRADVEVNQFVGSLFGIPASQFDRVADAAQFEEIDSLDRLPVLDIQAGDDSLR